MITSESLSSGSVTVPLNDAIILEIESYLDLIKQFRRRDCSFLDEITVVVKFTAPSTTTTTYTGLVSSCDFEAEGYFLSIQGRLGEDVTISKDDVIDFN